MCGRVIAVGFACCLGRRFRGFQMVFLMLCIASVVGTVGPEQFVHTQNEVVIVAYML